MPAARCVGAAPSVVLAVSALSWGALWPSCLWRLLAGAVSGATGTLLANGVAGGLPCGGWWGR